MDTKCLLKDLDLAGNGEKGEVLTSEQWNQRCGWDLK